MESLETNPKIDPEVEAESLIHEHMKSINPFDSDELNRALASARELGKDAEKEFLKVSEVLGENVNADKLLEKIRKKFQKISTIKLNLTTPIVFDHSPLSSIRLL